MIRFPSKPFILPGYPLIEQALNLFRIAVEGAFRDLNQCPFVVGSLIQNIELTPTASNRIYHKLGKKPRGWIVTRATGTGARLKETDNTTPNELYIDIYSYYDSTVDIWFF